MRCIILLSGKGWAIPYIHTLAEKALNQHIGCNCVDKKSVFCPYRYRRINALVPNAGSMACQPPTTSREQLTEVCDSKKDDMSDSGSQVSTQSASATDVDVMLAGTGATRMAGVTTDVRLTDRKNGSVDLHRPSKYRYFCITILHVYTIFLSILFFWYLNLKHRHSPLCPLYFYGHLKLVNFLVTLPKGLL